MIDLIFDQLATQYGQDYHPERPERLIHTGAYLLDKHPDWVWKKPRLAPKRKYCEPITQNIWSVFGCRSILTPTPLYPGIEEHARRAAGAAIRRLIWRSAAEKVFL